MVKVAVAALIAGAWLAASAAAARCGAVISGARIDRRGQTVELHFAITGNTRLALGGHGNQLWIDCPSTKLDIPPRPLFGHDQDAPLALVRAIDNGNGTARIALEVEGKCDYAVALLPDEILVRIAPQGADREIAAPVLVRAKPPKTSPVSTQSATRATARHKPSPATPIDTTDAPIAMAARVAAARVFAPPTVSKPVSPRPPLQVASLETEPPTSSARPVVVIDPGHGGYDPGTAAAAGVAEKNVALQIARDVAQALKTRGAVVKMTRDSDYFLSLKERTKIANDANADLFVSIHLNSSPDRDTTGLEVYYLNNTTDRATIRLARMENAESDGYSTPSTPDLHYILSDLRQQYKATESASLARMIDATTVAELETEFPHARGLGARKGPFYVLVGAHMPAVLVECGFLSNGEEAQRLAQPDYQAQLAAGIAEAVMHYLNADAAVGNL